MDAKDQRIAELEACCRECWGVVNLVKLLYPDDAKVRAAVAKVDAKCRATGLMAREGMVFIEPPTDGVS